MRRSLTIAAVVLTILVVAVSAAAQTATAPPPVKIVIVPAKTVDSLDGETLYQAYCASCHGRDGKGNGRAARALPQPVPDLTQIAATHSNQNCLLHVLAELQQGHSSQMAVSDQNLDMPNWRPIFESVSAAPGFASLRLHNVARHVASLQASAAIPAVR